jgi:NAD(P)-dependent dehydrogenase (short-subunit alcohol dehydrogenase family)
MMKLLLTRVREESLSGKIAEMLNNPENKFIDVYALPCTWDITDINTYPGDLGEYDYIINTSGITLNESVLQHEPNDARKVFDVNIIGAMNLTSEYARVRDGEGVIIHIGSTGSRKVFTNCSAYCASKAALAHYIQCAAYELKEERISVIGVHPGNMKGTHMTKLVQRDLQVVRGMKSEQIQNIYKDAHDTYDVASFIVNLLSMPFADITGENFYLGQGWKG